MKQFSIRPYRSDDTASVFEAADESRAHVSPWMGWLTSAYTRESAEAWVNHAISDWGIGSYEHLVIDDSSGKVAGCCGLNFINRINSYCNLGDWIRASYLRQGAAKSSTLQLRDFGFATAGMNRIEIVVATGNIPSRKVAESVGAGYEGILRKRLCVGEVSHDSHMFAFIRENS